MSKKDSCCNNSSNSCCKDSITTQPFMVDWAHSVVKVTNNKGELEEVGTVLGICNQIICLKPLSKDQLKELSRVVVQAVEHELAQRSN